jgi:hypothetical protein
MKILTIAAILLGISSLIAKPSLLLAHHSVGATFDPQATVTLEGTVTKIDWFNPHTWIYITVDGSAEEYQCEGSSPNSLRRRGWSKDSLNPGDQVTVEGLKARNDPYSCYARSVKLADGKQLFSGNASELGQ